MQGLYCIHIYQLGLWYLYHNVHRPGLYYKHTDPANSPPLQNEKTIAWHDIVPELELLAEIFDPSNETAEIPP